MIFTVPAPEPEAVFTVTEQRKFHRTRFEVTVLTEERYEPQDLDDLARDIYGGYDVDIKGRLSHLSTEVVTGAQAARELIAMDADPDFFGLDEHGNDTDESDGPDDTETYLNTDDDPEVFDTDDDPDDEEEDNYEEDPEPVMV